MCFWGRDRGVLRPPIKAWGRDQGRLQDEHGLQGRVHPDHDGSRGLSSPNWPGHQAPRRSVATPSHGARVDIAAGCVRNTSGARECGCSTCGYKSSPRRRAREAVSAEVKTLVRMRGCGEQVPGAQGGGEPPGRGSHG